MKKLLLSLGLTLLGLFLSNINANATHLKIVIDNETDQEIKINRVISNYSVIPDAYEFEEVLLRKGDKRPVDISIVSSLFFDLKDDGKLKENDGIYFDIGGKNVVPILWGLRPNTSVPVFEPLISQDITDKYQISTKIVKGGTFYIFIENKNHRYEINE